MKEIKYCPNRPQKVVKSKGLCRSCYEKQLLLNNPEYAERQRRNSLEYQIKHRDRITKHNRARDAKRRHLPEFKDQKRNQWLKKKYKLSLSEFREMLSFQNHKCAICEVSLKENDKFLHTDHCHKTGKVRGLLCSQCNWFMSKIDNVANCFRNLENYIKNQGVKWKKEEDTIQEN